MANEDFEERGYGQSEVDAADSMADKANKAEHRKVGQEVDTTDTNPSLAEPDSLLQEDDDPM